MPHDILYGPIKSELERRLFDGAAPLPKPDLLDLERRVADLEERARRQDSAEAVKGRLEALGFIFPKR